MQRILVSACLLGRAVRYDGNDAALDDATFRRWLDEGRLVGFCPEMAGGLPVPREPAEIEHGDAEAVLHGRAAVRTRDGVDVTDAFLRGAELALAECGRHGIRLAVLKQGSPSCGVDLVNDGGFTGRKIEGQGLTARLLTRHGIRVFGEHQITAASAYLSALEGTDGQ